MENTNIKEEINKTLNGAQNISEEMFNTSENVASKNNTEITNPTEDKKTNVTEKKKVLSTKNVKRINVSYYKKNNNTSIKSYSVFSSLDFLNRNSDLYHFTKSSISTYIKNIYTPEEIVKLMEDTNSNSFTQLCKKIEKATINGSKNITINNVVTNINKLKSQLKNRNVTDFSDENIRVAGTNTQLIQYENGPQELVYEVTNVYGDNRYFGNKDIKAYYNVLTPMFTTFEDDKEADQKSKEILDHVKSSYGYNSKFGAKENVRKMFRTITINKADNKMDNCVNMLYSVAKTMKGSKSTKLKDAKKILTSQETHDFLSSKEYVEDKNGEIKSSTKKIYKTHTAVISDVVATLTTIFMARFVFDSKYFPQIERDLTEQACNKMKFLAISNNPNDDYWINQLIQERLKVNIAQVCAANNITNAEQLLEVYNNNGTVIVNPENITCIDDLVFSVQHNTNKNVKNKKLENVPTNTLKAEKTIKNKKQKVQKPIKFGKKHVDYLEYLRSTPVYKEHYEKCIKKLLSNVATSNASTEELKAIKADTENTLERINNLAAKENLTTEQQEALVANTAANDAIADCIDEAIEEAEKIEEQQNAQTLEDAESAETEVNPDQITMDEILATKVDSPVEEYEQFSLFDDSYMSDVKKREEERTFAKEQEKFKVIDGAPNNGQITESALIGAELVQENIEENTNNDQDNGNDDGIVSASEETQVEQDEVLNETPKASEHDVIIIDGKEFTVEEIKKAKEEEAKKLAEEKAELEEEQRKLEEEESKKAEEENKETKVVTFPQFSTSKKLKELTKEELKKKVKKYFSKIILGGNGKVGIVGEKLSYRILEKTSKNNVSLNDTERLDDLQFKKANKIRNEKIELIIENLADKTVEYFDSNKENLPEDITVAKLCSNFVKYELNKGEDENFTSTDLKNCLTVLVTESVNPDLKSLNLELYTGKKTFKNYKAQITNLTLGEE